MSNGNKPYSRNKKKSVLYRFDAKDEFGVAMDITQTICLFHADLEQEYNFNYMVDKSLIFWMYP